MYANVVKGGIKCLAQGHNAVPPVRLEPAIPLMSTEPRTKHVYLKFVLTFESHRLPAEVRTSLAVSQEPSLLAQTME